MWQGRATAISRGISEALMVGCRALSSSASGYHPEYCCSTPIFHAKSLRRCAPSAAKFGRLLSFTRRAAASGPDPDDNNDSVDIDALVRKLSQEADRLRRTESNKEASTSAPGSVQHTFEDPIFGQKAQERQSAFLSSNEGGFVASEFEILQQLGKLSWVTESAKESPLQVTANSTEEVQAVIAFGARYFSGGPFQDPVKVLLKEFLPAARPVGCNELEVSSTLSGFPDMKWQAAAASLSADPPVVPILGYFRAGQSDTGQTLSQETMQGEPSPATETLWLVYKWESLQPISFYPAAEQPKLGTGLQFWAVDIVSDSLRARCAMLRSIARGILKAVAYCHAKGVAHGSLGSGSFLINTFDDRGADSVVVKMTNFGFAQRWSSHIGETKSGPPVWQIEDLQATAIVLLELIFSALAEGGPSANTSADPLKRLVMEVFSSDLDQFRHYVSQEADLIAPAVFLDQFGSSGWALIAALIKGERSAADLLQSNAFLSAME